MRNNRTMICIEECLRCYQSCFGMAMTHCLETGGKHIEPKHFRLMTACAEICRTAAHFMLMNSEHAKHLCKECAEICDQCAADCEKLGDMKECVQACQRCAEACRKDQLSIEERGVDSTSTGERHEACHSPEGGAGLSPVVTCFCTTKAAGHYLGVLSVLPS
jgi:hypothetical protein